MDYDFDDSGAVNKYFERKTFTNQQWELIREVGAENGYLKS